MIDLEFPMNDTLDNFSFRDVQSQRKSDHNTQAGVSFDDSQFLQDFDISMCLKVCSIVEKSQIELKVNTEEKLDSFTETSSIDCTNLLSDDINNVSLKNDSQQKTCDKDIEKLGSFSKTPSTDCTNLLSNDMNNVSLNSQENPCDKDACILDEVSSSDCNYSSHSPVKLKCNLNETKSVITITEEMYNLSYWSLPTAVLEKYAAKNITKMFHWQCECLCNKRVLNKHSNLIYSAPTSAGKTLVAEILALKTIFNRKKKVIFILPFVSIVKEKTYYFQSILDSTGIRVEGFMGSYNPPGGFSSIHFAICTIEKANSLINRLLEEGKLNEVGAVFVDEMHLVGDPHRGYLLELLLTKLRYISLKEESVQIQIIGMSATLPNLEELAKWLDAELYSTSFRPIPLEEQVSINGQIYDRDLNLVRKLEPLPDVESDTDNILQLCLEVIKDSYSVLIFCPTKNWCESLGQQLALAFYKIGTSQTELGELLRSQIKRELIMEVLEQLKLCPTGLDGILRKCISVGIAFHHAGLTIDERDIIEGAFRNGAVKILAATSTLSSGVNLPARRVIVRSPLFGGKPIDLLSYRQMVGRAGRLGKDTKGESILICQPNDYNIAKKLLTGELMPVRSCLQASGKLKRAILEVIASGVASSPEDVALFTNCTLLAVTREVNESLQDPISDALEFLLKHEFVRLHKNGDNDKYTATALGKACLSSSIGPDEAITLFTELEKARQCFVLDSELHLIYLVTPYSASQSWGNLDWLFFLELWEKMPSSMKRVGQLVGVSVSYMVGATRGRLDNNYHKQMVHKRFFVALVLQDLVNEVPLSQVCVKYSCNRGVLQSLQQSASTFAGMVTSFSRQLGWSTVEILLAQFQDRLQFGVSRDLLDLMRLPSLTGKLARILYKAGLETVIQLANSDVETVENILYKSGPFQSSEESKPKNTLRTVWISGRDGLTEREAAELLVKEARSYLVCEMGVKEAKWESTIEEHPKKSTESILKEDDLLIVENVQEEIKPDASENNITKALVEQTTEITSRQSLNESESSLFDSFETNALNQPISESTNSEDLISLHLSNDSTESPSKIEEFNSAELVENAEEKKRLRISCDSCTDSTPIKKCKTSTDIDSAIEKCTQLSLDDINPTKDPLRIVDVCQSEIFIQNFFDELQSKNDVSFCLICTQSDKPVSEIGGNIFGGLDSNETTTKNRKVHGFAFYWGEECFYLSVEKCEIYRKVIAKLGDIFKTEQRCVRMFDGKEYVKVLLGDCELEFNCQIVDPKILDWLLDVEEKERSFGSMLKHYNEDLGNIRSLCDQINKGNTSNEHALRACTEAVLTWHLVDFLKTKLSTQLPKSYKVVLDEFPSLCDLEMNSILIVAKMEVFGMSVNKTLLQDLTSLLNELQISIEKKAFALAGRRFNFNSSSDVAKVIGTHSGKRTSTKKKILEQNEHPISNLVIIWRKVNFTRTKTVYPLIRYCKDNRIYGVYDHHTATGRITMHEPSIQMVPKDFSVMNPITKKEVLISCRSAFSVPEGCILVSADYCQLELRILTYLSKDVILTAIMKKPGDIFTSIAAKWNGIPEEMVNLTMRHNVKQICYGIIYGMGAKTLAEHLEVSIEDATVFMESFRNTYLGIKEFIANTIQNCKKNGYVETILGRRRRLPGINDPDPTISGQAERQAVNTTVQGSAADLVKNAMATIERKIEFVFKKSRHKPKLVLQLHDELIYEVTEKYVEKTIRIVKTGMENSCKTFGYFPVKVKTGYSWGQLKEYETKVRL